MGAQFSQYAGVVLRTYPEKAVSMWVHLAHIMSGTDQRITAWWKDYNIGLHHGYSSIEEANFELDQCLYTRALVESTKNSQNPVSYPLVWSSDLLRHKKKEDLGVLCLERLQGLCFTPVPICSLLFAVWW